MKHKFCNLTLHADGSVWHLPYRHFCGGTSVKLPADLCLGRKRWYTIVRANGADWVNGRKVRFIQFNP